MEVRLLSDFCSGLLGEPQMEMECQHRGIDQGRIQREGWFNAVSTKQGMLRYEDLRGSS